MKKIIKLKESDLQRIVKRVLSESYEGGSIQVGDEPCDIWCRKKLAKSGSNGDVVKMIQHLLYRGQYNPKYSGGGMTGDKCYGNWEYCDGKFRGHTKDAVIEFQIEYGLTPDGVVGYNTLSKMCEVLSPAPSTNFNLCVKQCICEKKERREERDTYSDPIKFIDEIDCEILKDCVIKYILTPVPDYKGFEGCIGWGTDKKYSCEECSKHFKPGYINLMPPIDPTEEQMKIFNLGKWCVNNCDIYKAAV